MKAQYPHIRAIRTAYKKTTQQELAELLHISLISYRRYEDGGREIPLDAAVLLTRLYGVSLDYIASREKNQELCEAFLRRQITRRLDFEGVSEVLRTGTLRSTICFCPRIRELRRQRGYTQEQMAQKIYLLKTTYVRYETGKRHIPLNIACLIADILQVTLDELVQDCRFIAMRSFEEK